MSALAIFEDAPLDATVAWSDGAPRPPERHRRKLSSWKSSNSQGRLIRKQGSAGAGSITLHEGDFGGGVIAVRIHRTFMLSSSLQFSIVERPALSSIRVFDRAGDYRQLVHLAPHRAAAQHWLSQHRCPHAVIEDVPSDEAACEAVEGRVA